MWARHTGHKPVRGWTWKMWPRRNCKVSEMPRSDCLHDFIACAINSRLRHLALFTCHSSSFFLLNLQYLHPLTSFDWLSAESPTLVSSRAAKYWQMMKGVTVKNSRTFSVVFGSLSLLTWRDNLCDILWLEMISICPFSVTMTSNGLVLGVSGLILERTIRARRFPI